MAGCLIEDGIARNNAGSEPLPVDDLGEEMAKFAGKPETDLPGVIKRPCPDPAACGAEWHDWRMRLLWPFENSACFGSADHMDGIRSLPEGMCRADSRLLGPRQSLFLL